MDYRTILVAEDDEDDVFLMRRAFARAGSRAQIQFVPDGGEALAYLRGEGAYADRHGFPFPAMLLLDLKMPRMNGLEVLREIRDDRDLKRLVVVVFTSSDEQRDVDLALDLGANSYLVKPTDPEQLASLLHRVEDYWLALNQCGGEDAGVKHGEAEGLERPAP